VNGTVNGAALNGKAVSAKPAAPASAEPVAAQPVAVAEAPRVEAPKVEAPKKLSMAAMAAAAAKAPAPAPVATAHDDDDDDHDHPKKPHTLADAAKAAAASGSGRMLRADMSSTDRAGYIARAIANNRDPAQIKGEEGINKSDDGAIYWGPLDNESARAKAEGRLLTVDQFECISCGTCVEQTNRVFYLPVDGKATPIAQDGPMDLIQDAIEACPVTCIHWTDNAEVAEKGLATGVGEDWTEVIASLPVD
jgi:ferredoxin